MLRGLHLFFNVKRADTYGKQALLSISRLARNSSTCGPISVSLAGIAGECSQDRIEEHTTSP